MSSLSRESGKENFEETFTTAVHTGLDKVLGRSGTEAVLVRMKMTDNLPDAAEFHAKLLALFGPQGTLSLERAIVKDLAVRLRSSLALLNIEGSFDFSATMRAMKGARA